MRHLFSSSFSSKNLQFALVRGSKEELKSFTNAKSNTVATHQNRKIKLIDQVNLQMNL